MRLVHFELRGDYITLDALLKATGLAESGGRAKAMVAEGLVQVDGSPELRKSCKLRAGRRVLVANTCICVGASGATDRPAQDCAIPQADRELTCRL